MVKVKRVLIGLGVLSLCSSPLFAQEVEVPGDYGTIQEAIDALTANPSLGSVILIAPDVYEENLTITSSLTLRGDETARTVINADQIDEPTVSIANATKVTLRNLTFDDGEIALDVVNSAQVIVTNNVFALDDQALAARFDARSEAEVRFNVFYGNEIGVARASAADVAISNNIFAENDTAIDGTGAQVAYNCFFENTDDGELGVSAVVDEDPLFVDVAKLDFHLKEDSPCIDVGDGEDAIDGTDADIGAYGGADADPAPFLVQGVNATKVANSNSITVTWQPNRSYLVTHKSDPGGYFLYYDTDKSGAPYDGKGAVGGNKNSPIDVGNATSYALSDLNVDSAIPLAPVIRAVQPANEQITVSWSAVAGASEYTLYYGINDVEEHAVEVGTQREHAVKGLENGTVYQFAVRAKAQAKYYIAVQAYDSTEAENKSDYSNEVVVTMGDLRVSELSEIATAIPELLVPVPDLPNEGCFIATAAFGFYSAAQVEWLREFRDVHLKRFVLGRWFVKLYYTYSPRLAEQIRQSVYLQNVTRMALSPLIILSGLITHWQSAVLIIAGMLGVLGCMRKRRSGQAQEILR